MRKRIGILAAVFALFASVSAFAETLTLEQNLANAAAKIGKAIDGKVKTVAVLNIRSEHWALSDYIVEMLNDEFVNTLKKTAVVERDEQSLSLIQQETDYQYSGAVSDATIQSVGAALGADCIVLGNMETVSGGWQLIIRATAVESKKVLASWRGKVSSKEEEVKFQVEKSKKSPRPNSSAKSGADQGKSQKKKTTTKKKPSAKSADEYLSLGVEAYKAKNYAQAFKHFKKAADLGNAAGMAAVGEGYFFGEGVAQNYSKAVEYLKKAADLGNADALFDLGYCYEHGSGVTQNKSKALEYYRKAAAKDNLFAADAVRRLESQVSSSSSSSKGWLFPIFGLELGKSKESEVKRKSEKKVGERDYYVQGHDFECNESGVLYWVQFFNLGSTTFPDELTKKGYKASYTFGEWKSFIKSQGYTITKDSSTSITASKNTPMKHTLSVSLSDDGRTKSLRLSF